jgi:hypothetical protein
MKKAFIRILGNLLKEVHEMVLSTGKNESVAFLTANSFDTGEKIILLGNKLVSATPADYLNQGPLFLEVSPMYVNRVLNVAEVEKNTVIMVHSHPFEEEVPHYSSTDDHGEKLTSETISKCLEGNPPVGSMLFGQNHLNARVWTGLTKSQFPSSVSVLNGTRLEIHNNIFNRESNQDVILDRQIKALGESIQGKLDQLDIGIVGLGGTGSSVAEQLARMGVRKLRLVDHDKIELSNVSRLYGSLPADAENGAFKVNVVKSHLSRISPNLEIHEVTKSVMRQDVLKMLSNCDLIFSCLDSHGPRAVLNELSYQCFVPVIDVGVGLQKGEDSVVGGSIRSTIVGPGLPCLICQDIVRPEVIMAENLSPEEYEARREEEYVVDLPGDVPSVINYTTMAASLGLLQFVDLLSGTQDSPSTLIFDIGEKEIMRLRSHIEEDCVCQKRIGKGWSIPFSVAD